MRRLKEILRITVPLALGILIFWWVYRTMDFSQIWAILENGVSYQWLLLSVLLEIGSHIIRAARWQMLIRLLHAKPSVRTLTHAVFINYGANLVFPRLGEVWRCVYVARKEKISFTRVFGTMISERLVDIFVVALMIIVALFTMMDVFEDFVLKNIHLTNPFSFKMDVGLFYLFSAVGLVVCTVIYRQFKKTKLFLKIRTLLHDLWIGIKTLAVVPHKTRFTGWTLALWLTYFLQFYVCFFAFEFTRHLPLGVVVATFVMGTIAFSIPVQGGIGPWHFMVISTLIFYGVGQTEAAAFALVVHTLQTIINAIVGVYAFWITGTSKPDLTITENQ